jgi:hypothetical protein
MHHYGKNNPLLPQKSAKPASVKSIISFTEPLNPLAQTLNTRDNSLLFAVSFSRFYSVPREFNLT